ncbi:MAG: VWA domain-containing protein [Phycisphaerae bacterium]|nr:VWA domain-containing protein [Phycisphaerae bacterium]
MSDLQIDNVDRLRWLLVVVGCALVIVYGFARKKSAMRAFVSVDLLGVLAPDVSLARQYFKAILLLLAMTCVVLALIGPRWGTYWEDAVQRQLDLMVCLDVSRSMLAEDAGMSRLDRAKDDVKRLLDKLGGGSIGLVTFAGKAELACPLTDDYEFYRLALEDVGVHSAPLGGTDLGEAISAAAKAFGGGTQQQRVILLMTDGEDHGETAVREAKQARERGILVYTIGIGDEQQGDRIPVVQDGQRAYLVYDDQQVWSKMDPTQLRAIALAGGGEYHPSGQITPTQRTLEWVYEQRLAPMEQQMKERKQVARLYARFHWPAALALVLLMLETIVSERRVAERTKHEE